MKTAGKKKVTEAQEIQTLRWVHRGLGVVLLLDGCFGLLAVATSYQEDDLKALGMALLSECEFVAGMWLVAGREPRRTRPWIAAIFAGLWASSFYRGLTGHDSSARFASLLLGPWIVALFDLAALSFLLKWRPPRGETTSPPTFVETAAIAATILGVGIAGIAAPSLITASGKATRRDRPLNDAVLTFRRYSVQFEVRTDGQGAFRLPLVRAGRYTVSTPAERRPVSETLEDRKGKGARKADRKTTSKTFQYQHVLPQTDDIDSLSLDVFEGSTSKLKIDFQ